MELTVESLIFLLLSVMTLGAAALVVTSRNLFHAGLYLMVSLFGVAGLFALLNADFLVGAQVVVYIGAIAILIILAIMFTPGVTNMKQIVNVQWPAGIALAAIFFLLLVSIVSPLMGELGAEHWNADFTQEDAMNVPANSIHMLGEQLVDAHGYMLPFEVASVLLMAALIGAVLLVNPGKEEESN